MEPGSMVRVAKSARTNYLVKLFRGDVPLFISYWLFGILIGNVGAAVVELEIGSHHAAIVGSTFGGWFEVGFSLLVLVYFIFILIAIWRSAGKYRGSTLWKVLARISVGIGAIYLVVGLATGFAAGLSNAKPSDAVLKEKMAEMNKGMPRMIDKGTRLNRITMVGRDLHYDCTLIKYLAADLDQRKFSSVMTKKLKTGLCSKKATRAALDDGRQFVYEFHGKAGKAIATIAVEDADCLSAP